MWDVKYASTKKLDFCEVLSFALRIKACRWPVTDKRFSTIAIVGQIHQKITDL